MTQYQVSGSQYLLDLFKYLSEYRRYISVLQPVKRHNFIEFQNLPAGNPEAQRRHDTRAVLKDMQGSRNRVILPALCWNPRRRDFYAITTDVSAEGIRFRSSARLAAGEDLTCSIRHVGLVETRIAQAIGQEFVVSVRGGGPALAGLARQFVILSRAQDLRAEPVRVHRRIVPRQKAVMVTLEGGDAVPGHVLNLSASGVALLLDRSLDLGAMIRVGQKMARVMRHFTHGVGAAFVEPFELDAVHEAMTL